MIPGGVYFGQYFPRGSFAPAEFNLPWDMDRGVAALLGAAETRRAASPVSAARFFNPSESRRVSIIDSDTVAYKGTSS